MAPESPEGASRGEACRVQGEVSAGHQEAHGHGQGAAIVRPSSSHPPLQFFCALPLHIPLLQSFLPLHMSTAEGLGIMLSHTMSQLHSKAACVPASALNMPYLTSSFGCVAAVFWLTQRSPILTIVLSNESAELLCQAAAVARV